MSLITGLWIAVFLSGLYHGASPAMGWPLAVSSALMEKNKMAMVRALGALALGHALAMFVVLLPFAFLFFLVDYEQIIRLGGGIMVIGLGIWLLITRRHPRFLSRVPPNRLVLWSFLIAMVHGPALMLVQIYLGLCNTTEQSEGGFAASMLMTDAGVALLVTALHTVGMLLAGGVLAWICYRWAGLSLLQKSWFDLEKIWAISLILVGLPAVFSALSPGGAAL